MKTARLLLQRLLRRQRNTFNPCKLLLIKEHWTKCQRNLKQNVRWRRWRVFRT